MISDNSFSHNSPHYMGNAHASVHRQVVSVTVLGYIRPALGQGRGLGRHIFLSLRAFLTPRRCIRVLIIQSTLVLPSDRRIRQTCPLNLQQINSRTTKAYGLVSNTCNGIWGSSNIVHCDGKSGWATMFDGNTFFRRKHGPDDVS
jgi:hypothetical protein